MRLCSLLPRLSQVIGEIEQDERKATEFRGCSGGDIPMPGSWSGILSCRNILSNATDLNINMPFVFLFNGDCGNRI